MTGTAAVLRSLAGGRRQTSETDRPDETAREPDCDTLETLTDVLGAGERDTTTDMDQHVGTCADRRAARQTSTLHSLTHTHTLTHTHHTSRKTWRDADN